MAYATKVFSDKEVLTHNHMNNIIYLDLELEGLDDEYIDNKNNLDIIPQSHKMHQKQFHLFYCHTYLQLVLLL